MPALPLTILDTNLYLPEILKYRVGNMVKYDAIDDTWVLPRKKSLIGLTERGEQKIAFVPRFNEAKKRNIWVKSPDDYLAPSLRQDPFRVTSSWKLGAEGCIFFLI
jgi:hypothetical protein